MNSSIRSLIIAAIIVAATIHARVFAGVPLNNLEGVGGVAFNPLAYTAGSGGDVLSKPQIGGWYVNLDQVDVDWTTIGVADTLFKRLELSYGYETINQANTDAKHKNNLGAKLLLLPENSFDTKFLPAVSVGSIYKHTSNVGPGIDASGTDFYLVATKLIPQLPKPVLVSAGVLSTKGRVTGVFGFDKDRDVAVFANIDVILRENIAVGAEYKQGAKFRTFKNADYWNAHVAWLVNKNVALVAAYVNAGHHTSASKVGLNDGVVLSAHYAF